MPGQLYPGNLDKSIPIFGAQVPDDFKSLLRDCLRWIQWQVHRRLVEAGYADLRPADANVLQYLDWDEGSRIQDLAARAQMTWQSMAELVAHLEQGGYVARRPDPRDRRARIVYLTERGRALTPIAISALRDAEAKWREIVGQAALDNLRHTLQDIWSHLEE
jgi:DNA-binding MarR family transcriptional regulator